MDAYRQVPDDQIVILYLLFPPIGFFIQRGHQFPVAMLIGFCLGFAFLSCVYSSVAFLILRTLKRHVTFKKLLNVFFLSMIFVIIMHLIDHYGAKLIMNTVRSDPAKAISREGFFRAIQYLTWFVCFLTFASLIGGAYFASGSMKAPNE